MSSYPGPRAASLPSNWSYGSIEYRTPINCGTRRNARSSNVSAGDLNVDVVMTSISPTESSYVTPNYLSLQSFALSDTVLPQFQCQVMTHPIRFQFGVLGLTQGTGIEILTGPYIHIRLLNTHIGYRPLFRRFGVTPRIYHSRTDGQCCRAHSNKRYAFRLKKCRRINVY